MDCTNTHPPPLELQTNAERKGSGKNCIKQSVVVVICQSRWVRVNAFGRVYETFNQRSSLEEAQMSPWILAIWQMTSVECLECPGKATAAASPFALIISKRKINEPRAAL